MFRSLKLCILCVIYSNLTFAQNADQIEELLDDARTAFSINPDSASLIEKKALKMSRTINYSEGIVRSNFYLGYYYQKAIQNYPLAITNYLEAIHNSSPTHDSLSLGWALYANLNASNIFDEFGLQDLSMDFLMKARDLAQSLQNEKEINKIDINTFIRLRKQKEYSKAISVLDGVIQRVEIDDPDYLKAKNGIGICQAYSGDLKGAKQTYEELIATAKSLGRTDYEDFGYHNIADLLIKNREWSKAEEVLEQVLETKLKRLTPTKRDANLLGTYKDLLKTKLQTDQPRFIIEIENDLEGLIPDVKKTDPNYYFKIYPLMAEAYSKIDQPDKAEQYLIAYETDSVKFIKTRKKLDYEIKKEELEAIVAAYYAELEKERKAVRSRNLLLSAIVGLSFLLIALVAYHLITKYRVRKMLAQSLEQLNWDD